MTNQEIPLTAIIHRREDLAAQDLDGDIVMADIHAGQFYGLGDSARRIWDLLDQPKSPTQLCESLTEEVRRRTSRVRARRSGVPERACWLPG